MNLSHNGGRNDYPVSLTPGTQERGASGRVPSRNGEYHSAVEDRSPGLRDAYRGHSWLSMPR
jgi:hypothetical protein